MSFDAGSIVGTLDLDRSPFNAGLTAARKDAEQFRRNKITVPLTVDAQRLRAELDAARRKLAAQQAIKLPVTANLAKARADIAAFRKQVAAGPTVKLPVEANLAKARQQITAFRRGVATGPSAKLTVEGNVAQARRDAVRVRREIAGMTATMRVTADTKRAREQGRAASRDIGGQRSQITVTANTRQATGMLALVTAGVAAIGYAVPAAVAALAAIPMLAGTAAQAVAGLAMAFSGIGGAVSALEQREQQAATASVGASGQRAAGLAGVQAAQQSLADAQRQAARSAIQGDEQMRQARLAYAAAVTQASRQTEAAEEALRMSQLDARRAQLDLNQAREQARIQLRNYRLELSGAALDEESAVLALERAQIRMEALRRAQSDAPGSVPGLDMREADLAVRQAQQQLAEIRQSNGDLRREATAAAKAGVQGDAGVLAARRQLLDANQAVLTAERDLQRARVDGAADVAEANRQLLITQREVAWQNADAARQVVRAQASVAQAMSQTGAAAAGAGAAMFDEFAKATPAGQQFARFLKSEFLPNIRGIKAATQAAALPRMETALRNLMRLTPGLKAGFAETGAVFGDLAIKGSRMMASGPWRRDAQTLMASGNRMIGDLGTSGLNLADAFRSLAIAAAPMLEKFTQWTEKSTAAFNAMIQGKRNSGELGTWFDEMGDRIAWVGNVLGRIIGGAWDFAQAMAPMGAAILAIIGYLADFVSWLSDTAPWLLNAGGAALVLFGALAKLGSIFAGFGGKAGLAMLAVTKLTGALKWLAPAMATAKIAEFGAGWQTAGTQSQTAGSRFKGAAGAAISGMSGMLGKLPLVAAALAVAAAGWDAITISSAEAKQAFANGGAAATKAAGDLKAQGDMVAMIGQRNSLLGGVLDAVTTDWHEYRSGLKGVEAAQADVGRAQWVMQQAISTFGPASGEARLAGEQLRGKMKELEIQQRAAADGISYATAKLRVQRDQMLAMEDGKIAYQQALIDITNAVRTNGRTLDWNTQAGLDNRRALQTLATQGIENVAQMRKQNEAQWKVSRAERQLRQDFIDSAVKMGMSRVEARKYAEKLGLIPETADTKANFNKKAAEDKRRAWERNLSNMTKKVDIFVNITGTVQDKFLKGVPGNQLLAPLSMKLAKWWHEMASGGEVRGPGTGTSDDVPIMASNGEFVVRALQAKQNMPLLEAINSGKIQKLASGGQVGKAAGRRKAPAAAAAAPSRPVAGGDGAAAPVAVPALQTGVATAGLTALTGVVQTLTGSGLDPLAAQITSVTNPALVSMQQQTGVSTVAAVDKLASRMPVLTRANTSSGRILKATWAQNTTATQQAVAKQTAANMFLANRVQAATGRIRGQIVSTQRQNNTSWQAITSRSGSAVRTMAQTQFPRLTEGLSRVRQAMHNTAQWTKTQFGKIYSFAASPARRVITGPLNALVKSWNRLAKDFAMKPRSVAPLVPGFQRGGKIPGAGRGDIVPMMGEPGEYVLPRPVVRAWGLSNIRRAHRDTLAGGSSGMDGVLAGSRRSDKETGRDRLAAMRKMPLDDAPMRMAYGGVLPHVAFAGNLITRMFGAMPGGIGGVGQRANVSDHPLGLALDFMTLDNRRLGDRVAQYLLSNAAKLKIKYLIWRQMINEGAGWSRMEDRGSITANHLDHVHASFLGAGQAGRAFGAGGMMLDPAALIGPALAKATRQIKQIREAFPGNKVAEIATSLASKAVAGVKQHGIKQLGATANLGGSAGAGRYQAYARSQLGRYGWGPGQMAPLTSLWNKESGWNPLIANGSSGAYGIPQSLPGNKMASAGADWRTNGATQIRWGLGYIKGRYGSPAAAWAHSQQFGWYDQGGPLYPGWTMAFNGTGGMEHVVTGDQWDAINDRQDRRLSNADLRALAAAIAAERRTGPAPVDGGDTTNNYYITPPPPPPGATTRELAETITFGIRHGNKGVHD